MISRGIAHSASLDKLGESGNPQPDTAAAAAGPDSFPKRP